MSLIKIFFKITLCSLMWSVVSTQFIYLNSGVFKFITGIGLPIDVEMPGGSLSWFTNFQVFYKLPDNITYFEPYKVLQKRAVRSIFNRANLYEAFSKNSERFGFSGSECIFRMICEVAQRNVNRNDNGLLGEIIHIFFSPEHDTDRGLEEHKEAQWHGLYNGSSCAIRYNDCYFKQNYIFWN